MGVANTRTNRCIFTVDPTTTASATVAICAKQGNREIIPPFFLFIIWATPIRQPIHKPLSRVIDMSTPAKSLIAKYMNQLVKATSSDGVYAYRGQANSNWDVESAAYRRLKKGKSESEVEAINQQFFIDYHRQEILEPARMNGYGIKDGQKLSDLELLAELQHNGAATCLIDLTRDFFVALWFACQSCKDEDGNEQNGKVFILNINDPGIFHSIEQKDMHHEGGIEAILNFQTREREKDLDGSPSYWHWSPHGMNQRILRQNSLFIFGKPNVDGDIMKEIVISQAEKSALLRELDLLGTTRESLFKDLPGFANIHGHEEPVALPLPQDNFRAGNAALQKGELEKAEEFYSKAVEESFSNNYKGAMKNLNKAIHRNPNNAMWYRFRGITRRILGKHDDAEDDLNRAIEIAPNKALLYHDRGLIRFEFDAESARKDLQYAKELAEQANDKKLAYRIEKSLSSIDNLDDV